MPNVMTVSEELEIRREIGQQMSNICYNLAQPGITLDDNTRRSMDELRKRWDATPKAKDSHELIKINATREALRTLMSDISEDHYCAGWLMGLEKGLWRRAFLGEEDDPFGFTPVEPSKLEALRVLAKATDSWWIWEDALIDQRCISFEEACKLFGQPQAMVCNCPPPNEYTTPSYTCPVHRNL